jgi:hypothetical protein
MRHRHGYEADEQPDGPEFADTADTAYAGEPVIDYSIWPPEPPYPEEARDESLRRLGKLTWRAVQLSAVAAAGFAILFVRTAPAPVTTSQNVARPASTLAPPTSPTPSPTPSAQHPHHRARGRGADDPAPSPAPDAAVAPGSAAPASPTLAPPTTPPAPSPSPSPAQSTSSGSHSGG